MKRKTGQLLHKAQGAIEAATLLLQGGKNDFAAGRAYYAMFYVAEALLFEKGLEFRKHGGFMPPSESTLPNLETWMPDFIAICLRPSRAGWRRTMG